MTKSIRHINEREQEICDIQLILLGLTDSQWKYQNKTLYFNAVEKLKQEVTVNREINRLMKLVEGSIK
jgi:hypothetical protein